MRTGEIEKIIIERFEEEFKEKYKSILKVLGIKESDIKEKMRDIIENYNHLRSIKKSIHH